MASRVIWTVVEHDGCGEIFLEGEDDGCATLAISYADAEDYRAIDVTPVLARLIAAKLVAWADDQ